VFLVQKGGQEEYEEYDDESSSREREHVENLIISTSELSVYI
jgi:hypothetical protein